MGYVDLHIHSIHSDGTFDARQIVQRALQNGASAISVTDHNVLLGSLEAEPLARAAGLKYVCGVEIDALFAGRDYHLLCYGADLRDPGLVALVADARARMDAMSDELLARMRPDFPQLDAQEYARMDYDPSQGGWKMLEYLCLKGITAHRAQGMRFYSQYAVTYAQAGFAPVEQVARVIRAAGGRAILAHPGVSIPGENPSREIEAVLETGLEGVECYYPRHTRAMEKLCLAICRRRGLLVSAGSDCHGAFQAADIAQTRTPEENVSLELLGVK